jgi:hypothetical protein
MDGPHKSTTEGDMSRKRGSRAKRTEEAATPADSEEEAEQIHQILSELNNIVNSEMRVQQKSEQEIVPVHLVKSPPKKKLSNSTPVLPRPWPGSSASDDDDSDIVEMLEKGGGQKESKKPNVLRVVQQLENMEKSAPKHFRDKHQKLQNLPIAMSKSISPINNNNNNEPRPDYSLPNFIKANQIANKFANFKSAKLYSSSPDNSGDSRSSSKNNVSSGYAEVYEKSTNGSASSASKYNISPRFSPNFEIPMSDKKRSSNHRNPNNSGGGGLSPSSASGLRRSESLHASLASIEAMPIKEKNMYQYQQGIRHEGGLGMGRSMESLHKGKDENFTLRWRYPNTNQQQGKKSPLQDPTNNISTSPKSGSKTAKLAAKNLLGQQGHKSQGGGGGEGLCLDYRQNRFTKNVSKSGNNAVSNGGSGGNNNKNGGSSSPLNIFARYSKKSSPEKDKQPSSSSAHHHHQHPPTSYIHQQKHHQQVQLPGIPGHHQQHHNDFNQKEKENMKMFSLPPIMMPHAMDNHRLTDLPSGLY